MFTLHGWYDFAFGFRTLTTQICSWEIVINNMTVAVVRIARCICLTIQLLNFKE